MITWLTSTYVAIAIVIAFPTMKKWILGDGRKSVKLTFVEGLLLFFTSLLWGFFVLEGIVQFFITKTLDSDI